MRISKHKQNLHCKLKKDFAFETDLIRHSFKTLEAVARRCSARKGVLRNYARPATVIKKETLAQVFFCEFVKFLRAPF